MGEETDKQILEELLEKYGEEITLEEVIYCYLYKYKNHMSNERLLSIRDNINSELNTRMINMAQAIQLAIEKSMYLSNYLEGNMYTEEADPDACRKIQLMNAETLLDTVLKVQL